jgi:hypothetical protein
MEFEELENPWRRRSKLAFAIGGPTLTAGVAIFGGLWGGGYATRGCAGDHPCLTDWPQHRHAQLGPDFDIGGTILGTPVGQRFVFIAPQ